jgi:hypothetical protein
MHKHIAFALGTFVLACSAGTGHAACTQLELAGAWQAFGTAEAGAAVSGRCVLRFNSLGFLAATSKCSFHDNTLNANVTVGVAGGLHLRNATNCSYEGTITIAGGTYNTRATSLKAGLSRDKTILMAIGTIVNDPNGAVSFTAMKP